MSPSRAPKVFPAVVSFLYGAWLSKGFMFTLSKRPLKGIMSACGAPRGV